LLTICALLVHHTMWLRHLYIQCTSFSCLIILIMHSLHNMQKVNPSGNGHVLCVMCVCVHASVQALCKLQEKNMHRVCPQYVCFKLRIPGNILSFHSVCVIVITFHPKFKSCIFLHLITTVWRKYGCVLGGHCSSTITKMC
jgi:hypothetical protein